MRKMVIVVLALALILAMVVPLLADAGNWRLLASGGKWRGERDVDAPGALNRNLERNNCEAPWLSG